MIKTEKNRILYTNKVELLNSKEARYFYTSKLDFNSDNYDVTRFENLSREIKSSKDLLDRIVTLREGDYNGRFSYNFILHLRNKYYYTMSILRNLFENKEIEIDLSKLFSEEDVELLEILRKTAIPTTALKELVDKYFKDFSLFIKIYPFLSIKKVSEENLGEKEEELYRTSRYSELDQLFEQEKTAKNNTRVLLLADRLRAH